VSAQRGAHVAAVEAKVQLAVRSYGELADWQAFLDNTEPSTSVKASDDRDSSNEGIEVLLNAFGNSPPGPARDEALRKYANAIQHAAARDVRKEYESIAAEQLLQCGDYLPIEISSARGGGAHIAVMRIDTFNASGDGRSEARLFIMGGEGVEKGDKIQRRVIWDVAGHKRERVGFVGTVL